jgi:hypothetical protein
MYPATKKLRAEIGSRRKPENLNDDLVARNMFDVTYDFSLPLTDFSLPLIANLGVSEVILDDFI